MFLFSSCKKDGVTVEPDNIFYWKLENPKFFYRADTIIDVKSEILCPFKVDFEYADLENYTLKFNGGDTLLFLNLNCENRIKEGTLIATGSYFDTEYIFDKYVDGETTCSDDTSFFVSFKRVYKNNYRTNFGWFEVKKPLSGLWYISSFGYNRANHRPIKIGQKE